MTDETPVDLPLLRPRRRLQSASRRTQLRQVADQERFTALAPLAAIQWSRNCSAIRCASLSVKPSMVAKPISLCVACQSAGRREPRAEDGLGRKDGGG